MEPQSRSTKTYILAGLFAVDAVVFFFLGRVTTPAPVTQVVSESELGGLSCEDEILEVRENAARDLQFERDLCTFQTNMSKTPEYGFKKVGDFTSGITFEVPGTWSEFSYSSDAVIIEKRESWSYSGAFLSVGETDVKYGDTNWTQIDFYFSNGNFEKLIEEQVSLGAVRSTEEIGGHKVDVLTWPLDNGEVTKGGTGGKEYYIKTPNTTSDRFKAIVIRKQALGPASFEDGFRHLIKTLVIPGQ